MNWIDFSQGFALGVCFVCLGIVVLFFAFAEKTEDDHTNH